MVCPSCFRMSSNVFGVTVALSVVVFMIYCVQYLKPQAQLTEKQQTLHLMKQRKYIIK